MESQERPAKAWYEIRTDLPDDLVVLPVETSAGTVIAVREGHMSEELCSRLNEMLDHLIGDGIWQPGRVGKPRDPDREE
jgi:hypothetical protein